MTFLKVKNTIALVPRRKEGFLGLQLDYPSSYASFREESGGVEPGKASPSHFEGLLAGGNSRVEDTSGNSHLFIFEVGCLLGHTVEPKQVHTRTVEIGARGKGGKLSRNCGSCQSKGWLRQSHSVDRIDLDYHSRFQSLSSRVSFAASRAGLFWEEIGSVLRLPLYSLGLRAKWHRNVAAKWDGL